MNKTTIGGFLLVVFAGLLLLLLTCEGPSADERGGPNSPVATAPSPAPVPRDSNNPNPAGPDSSIETAPAPVEKQKESVPTAAPDPLETAPAPSSQKDFNPPPSLPVDELSVAGVEALLAVHPRTLEGGSGTGLLLVPADSLRNRLRISVGGDREWLPTDYTRGQPSSTINTPTAYGQRWGDVFGGVAYQERIRYDDWSDGVASFGVGLGNPSKYIGVDVSVHLLDTYTEFAKDWSLSLKLHRRLPYRTAIAVGHENLWHTDGTDGGSSRYMVVSKVFFLRDRPTASFGSMVLNVGLGNDRFLPEGQFVRGEGGVNAFGSLALRLLPPVNAVANWTGQDLALGLSIAPVRTWPLIITPAVMDVTGRAGDGARFTIGVGLNYSFRQ